MRKIDCHVRATRRDSRMETPEKEERITLRRQRAPTVRVDTRCLSIQCKCVCVCAYMRLCLNVGTLYVCSGYHSTKQY